MPVPTLPVSGAPNNWLATSTKGATLVGNGLKKNQLAAQNDGITLIGAALDDTFIAYSSGITVVEAAGAGIDTVITWGNGFALTANVENLTLNGTMNSFAVGTAGNNILKGNDGANWIHAGGGLDVLTGGAGADTFILGKHTGATTWITDLSAADKLDLNGHGFQGFAAARAAMSQVGADVRINLGNGQTAMIANRQVADITSSMVAVEPAPGTRTLTFSDEFDSLSLRTGSAATAGGRWKTSFYGGERTLAGNHELEYYVDPDFKGSSSTSLGINPFSVSNGVLKISARPADAADKPFLYGFNYTSGLLTTQTSFQQKYGYFEIRADTPAGKGLFPAFWMLAPAKWPPEIDVFEQIGSAKSYVSNGIASASGHANKGTTTGIDMTAGFHTYGMEWTAQKITWFIDGKQSFQVATPADMHQPMYLLVNLAVGGDWAGAPDGTTDWSKADLLVDYIRVYSNGAAPPPPPPPPVTGLTVVLSNLTNPLDLSDSFTLTTGVAGTSTTFTGTQMAIAGVAAATTVTAAYAADGDLTLTNNAAWNAIKNATVTDTAARGVDVRNFVDVEITMGSGADSVAVTGAKRGTITTNGGNDAVTVNGTSNDALNNLIKILGGTGDDTISFAGGGFSRTTIDGGDGIDRMTITGAATGSAVGGIGNDRLIDRSSSAVTLTGGSGADVFEISAGTKASITDFVAGVDQIQLIGISPSVVNASASGGNTTLTIGAGYSVALLGVTLTETQINPIYG